MVNTGHNYTPKKKYLSLFFIFEASIINSVLSRISFFEPRIAGNSAGSGVIQVFLTLCGRQILLVLLFLFYNSPEIFVNKANYILFSIKCVLYPTGLSRRGLIMQRTIQYENVGEMFGFLFPVVLSLLSDED